MEIIILILLNVLNGFFALSEIALVSVKKQRIEQKASRGNKNAKIVLSLLDDPESFLSSVQVGITLIGIISGVYGGVTLVNIVQPYFTQISEQYAHELAYASIIGLITYFSIVIGELIPKSIALTNPERYALAVAPVIKVFTKVTYPFVKLLTFSTQLFTKLFKVDENVEHVTEEEIRYMIKTAGKQGVLEKEESELHQNVFTFTSQRARNLMTHRSDVIWVDSNDSLEDIEKIIRETTVNRVLVCDDQLDHIQGILNVKTFFENKTLPTFNILDILEEPLFVHDKMYSIDILKLFKEKKKYLAVVIDEYGTFEGVVTIKDMVETIIGDMPEDDSIDEDSIVDRGNDSYIISGSMYIQEINDYFDEIFIEIDDDKYQTLAGFILNHLGSIPELAEKFVYNDYEFEVVDKDDFRIDKVLVTKVKP